MIEDKRNTPTASILKDKDEEKRFPNSVAAIIRTVVRFWLKKVKPDEFTKTTSVRDFLENSDYASRYYEAQKRYPKRSRPSGLKQGSGARHPLHDMIDKLSVQATEFDYLQLRAISDFMGVSESACMLLAKLISVERRLDDPVERQQATLQLLDAHRRMIEKALDLVNAPDGVSFAATIPAKNADTLWVANIDTLHDLVTSYRDGDLSAVDEAMQVK